MKCSHQFHVTYSLQTDQADSTTRSSQNYGSKLDWTKFLNFPHWNDHNRYYRHFFDSETMHRILTIPFQSDKKQKNPGSRSWFLNLLSHGQFIFFSTQLFKHRQIKTTDYLSSVLGAKCVATEVSRHKQWRRKQADSQ